MKKIGTFITSLFAALTLAGVGIGVGQNLAKNEDSHLEVFAPPSISSGYAIYTAPQGDIVAGETATFDFGILDKDGNGISGASFFIISNLNLSNFAFTADFTPKTVPYNESGTTLDGEQDLGDGTIAYQITFGIDLIACTSSGIDPSINSGKFLEVSFDIPSDASGEFTFFVMEASVTDRHMNAYDSSQVNCDNTQYSTTIKAAGSGGSGTSETTSNSGAGGTSGGGTTSESTSGSGSTSSESSGGSGTGFDESKVTEDYALYAQYPSSLPKGSVSNIDLYVYDKNSKGITSTNFFYVMNVYDPNFSATVCATPSNMPYLGDGVSVDEIVDLENGTWAYYVSFGIDMMTAEGMGLKSIDPGKFLTISFTIPTSMTENFNGYIFQASLYDSDTLSYTSDEGNINLDYSQSGSIPLVASSSDNSIKTLTVDGTAVSSSGTTYTTTTTDSTKTTADVKVTLNDSNAKVKSFVVDGNTLTASSGTYSVPLGATGSTKTATIIVEAQNGSTKTYTLSITRAKSNANSLSGLTITQTGSTINPKLYNAAGTDAATFNGSTTEYTVKISEGTTKLTFKPTVGDSNAVIRVNGTTVASGATIDITALTSDITITVTAQDNSIKTYTFHVVKLSDDASATITATTNSGQTIALTKSGNAYTSTSNLDFTVTSFTVNAVVHEDATVTYSANKTFTFSGYEEQTGTVTVKVTSASGIVETYTVNIKRNKADGNTNFTITVTGRDDGIVYTKTSSSTTTIYNYELPESAGAALITVTDYVSTTVITGAGEYAIPYTGIKVRATAQSSAYKEIQINIQKGKDTDNKITNIKVLTEQGGSQLIGTDGNSIVFNESTQQYTLTVGYNVATVYFDVTTSSPYATIVNGGTKSLTVGTNSIVIYANSESGSKGKEYTFKITKNAASTNCNIEKITVGSQELTSFTASGNTYTSNTKVYVDRTTSTVNVAATLASDSQSATILSGTGTSRTLSMGKNTLTVQVQAQSGTIRSYNFDVIKGDRDNTISSISLSTPDDASYVFSFSFDPSTTTYNLNVPYAVASVVFAVTATNAHATVTAPSGAEALLQGGSKTFKIYATSESDEKGKEYIFVFNRESPQTGNTLTAIKVGTYSLDMSKFSGTSALVYSDSIYVDRVTENLDVATTLASDSSRAVITGDAGNGIAITIGKNEFVITVRSESGSTKSYKFYVYRGETSNSITAMTISGIDEFAFNQSQLVYPSTGEYVVPYSISNVTISITTDSRYGTVKGSESFGTINSSGISSATVTLSSGNIKVIKIYIENEVGEKGTEYTIRIKRETSTESDPPKINDIKVVGSNGINYYTFSESNLNPVSISVPYTVTGVIITVSKPTGSNNIVYGAGTFVLDAGATKTFYCYVTLPDGSDETHRYEIRITRENASTDATLSGITVDGVAIDGFSSSNEEYTVYKSRGTTGVTIVATPNDSKATVSISGGSWSVAISSIRKEVNITVLAEDSSTAKTYKLIILTGDTENGIYDITIDDISEEKFLFNKDTTSYPTFTVSYSVNSLVFNVTKVSTYSTVSIEGADNLKVGINQIKVYATSEVGEKGKVYLINVERKAAGSNVYLSDITVDGVSIEGFSNKVYNYTVYVAHGTPGVLIGATTEDVNSIITAGLGYKAIQSGRNEQTIVVNAEDGSIQNYKLTIYCGERKNTITDIRINGIGNNVFVFNSSQTTYPAFTVPYKTQFVEIEVDYDGMYGVVTGSGTKPLAVGDNIIQIYVTSEVLEKGTTYTIEIIREDVDTNNYLSSLEVIEDGVNLIDNFSAFQNNYVLILKDTTSSIRINAVLDSSKATLTGDVGIVSLSKFSGQLESGNVIFLTVTVTAENGTTNEYRISVSRDNVDLSDDNTISKIEVVGSDGVTYFSSEYDTTILSYTKTLPYFITSFTVTVTSNADVFFKVGNSNSSTKTKTFVFTNNDPIVFTIYAISQSGLSGSYYEFEFDRELADETTHLEYIKINGELIDGFDATLFTYNIKKPYSVKKIDITVSPASNDSSYSIIANGVNLNKDGLQIALNEGVNVITITVFAQSGAFDIYTLNVTRQSNRPVLSMLDVDGYILQDKDGQEITFNENVLEYYVVVNYEVTSVNITAETYDPTITARIFYESGKKLVVGVNANRVLIYAIPEDSDLLPTVYTVYITRKTKNTDNVNVGGITIIQSPGFDLNFKSDVFTYSIKVQSNVSKLDIDVSFDVSADETAPKYEIVGNDNLRFGLNTVVIIATSSMGINKAIYIIDVERESVKLNSANIAQISEFATEFDNDIDVYSYQVDGSVSSLDISFEPDNESTEFIVSENAKKLEKGSNLITINVYSGGELAKKITLMVFRGSGQSTIFDAPKVVLVAVYSSVSALALIGVVVTFIVAKTYKRKRG